MERFWQKIAWISQISWSDGLIAFGIFFLFISASILFSKYMPKLLKVLIQRSKSEIDGALLISFRKPLSLVLMASGLFLSLSYLPVPRSAMYGVTRIYSSLTTLAIGWGFYLFCNTIGLFFHQVHDHFDLQFNNILIPFLTKIGKFLVVVFTAVAILDQWNYHVTGLITGLGIGGLAIAMAAKDTLSNFFGGLVIITDAPFTIGELIQSGTIEGIVEDINFRSTKIRTADQALVTVPNSTLANQPITNMSRIGKRRVTITASLSPASNNAQLDRCLSDLRELLGGGNDIYSEGQLVYVDKISQTGIDLSIQFFTKTIDFNEWTQIKEKYNLAILHIFEQEGLDLAAVPLILGDKTAAELPKNMRRPQAAKPESTDDTVNPAMRTQSHSTDTH
ncbi:MAG: mechanosensitive ion channel family protein [Sporolactobacillus sp.]